LVSIFRPLWRQARSKGILADKVYIKEKANEKNISTEQDQAGADPWIPFTYGDSRWPPGHQQAARQGSQAPGPVIRKEINRVRTPAMNIA